MIGMNSIFWARLHGLAIAPALAEATVGIAMGAGAITRACVRDGHCHCHVILRLSFWENMR
jgi:hypothetical protein